VEAVDQTRSRQLFELKPDHVDAVIGKALAAKRGTQTVKHIKKVISAVIEYARVQQQFTGENPAQLVELPDHVPVRRPHAMTIEQCRTWFAVVNDKPANVEDRRSDARPLRSMSLLGICCSLGTSEQPGLTWRQLNLTEKAVLVDGDTLEPFSASIRAHC
jgi:site-specific recombinase XerC